MNIEWYSWIMATVNTMPSYNDNSGELEDPRCR